MSVNINVYQGMGFFYADVFQVREIAKDGLMMEKYPLDSDVVAFNNDFKPIR